MYLTARVVFKTSVLLNMLRGLSDIFCLVSLHTDTLAPIFFLLQRY